MSDRSKGIIGPLLLVGLAPQMLPKHVAESMPLGIVTNI